MKKNMNQHILATLLLILVLIAGTISATAQEAAPQDPLGVAAAVGTGFTYQGRLTQGSNAVTGACDFRFSLWDAAAGGSQVGATLTQTGVVMMNGFFDVLLDFGDGGLGVATFTGDARWLAISVSCPTASGAYTPLAGRVALTATPYALSLRPGAAIIGDKNALSVLTVRNTTTGEFGSGLRVETTAAHGAALIAEAKSTSLQQTYGVYATTTSRGGTAVYGESKQGGSTVDNTAYGGYFKAQAAGDVGVYGESAWSQGGGVGVWGKSAAASGVGVYGEASAATGATIGVKGQATASGGRGVYGYSASGHGVHGKANPPDGYALYSEGNTFIDGKLFWKAQTSHLAVSAAAFQPVNNSYTYANWGNLVTPADTSSPYYYAPVQLPHGALITRLTFAWRDHSANDAECKLWRNNLAGGGDEMARVVSSGSTGNGGGSDPSINHALIDAANYAYYLQWYLPDPNTSGYGVNIEYLTYGPY